MKTFIRKIIVLTVVNVAVAGSVLAVNASEAGSDVRPASSSATTPANVRIDRNVAVVESVSDTLGNLERYVISTRLPSYHGTGSVLVIPSTEMKLEDIAAIMQDLSIMSRIFDKQLASARFVVGGYPGYQWSYSRSARAWTPNILFNRQDGGASEAIYLGGFGALFLIDVDFPLSPPSQVQAEKPEEAGDPVWQQMQKEIYSPQERSRRRTTESEIYIPEKVEDLQRTLIKALKHAANIRNLKPDECVTIMVSGTEAGIVVDASGRGRLSGEVGSIQPAFLTIRAKKSDIDRFAKAELDYDKFRERVQTMTY